VKSRSAANSQAGRPQALRGFSGLTGATLSILLAACAHHPASVHCDARLQPINLPAPIQPDGADAARRVSPLPAGKAVIERKTAGKPASEGLPVNDAVTLDRESPKP
jgi:hypothetical protein